MGEWNTWRFIRRLKKTLFLGLPAELMWGRNAMPVTWCYIPKRPKTAFS
jgi:hypothetical protein